MNKEEIDLLEIVFTLAIGECAYNDINDIQKLEYKIKIINKTIDKLRLKHNTQQKEFIEYMNKTIEECNNYSKYIDKKIKELHGRSYGKTYIANEIMKNEVAKKILKETLSKYKKIIGGKDVK